MPEFWYDRFIDPNFRHCWAVRWDGFNWIRVYSAIGFTNVEVLPWTKRTDLENIVGTRRWAYVETIVEPKRERVPQLFCTWHCVEQIKALLGIRDVRIITPKQLWDYLVEQQV